jgi:hypothetical protein
VRDGSGWVSYGQAERVHGRYSNHVDAFSAHTEVVFESRCGERRVPRYVMVPHLLCFLRTSPVFLRIIWKFGFKHEPTPLREAVLLSWSPFSRIQFFFFLVELLCASGYRTPYNTSCLGTCSDFCTYMSLQCYSVLPYTFEAIICNIDCSIVTSAVLT